MVHVYYDDAADLALIQDRTVALLDFGDRGRAHALSLRDSGVDVRIGLPAQAPERVAATDEGLRVLTPGDACAEADVIVMLTDGGGTHRQLYAQAVAPNLLPGKLLVFDRGWEVRYGLISPPPGVDVTLVAAQAPGELIRRQFVDGRGVPCLVAVGRDATGEAKDLAFSYAKALGAARAGILETTFDAAAEAALFGEQAVSYGGVVALVRKAFETLIAAGYAPELAYFECLHGLRDAVDAMAESGVAGMLATVPAVTAYGGETRGARVVGDAAQEGMRQILTDIQDGTFVREWSEEDAAGRSQLRKLQEAATAHPLEIIGAELRRTMPWVRP